MDEAARVLRIGRTKAYAMAHEWLDTNGASGLPVIDLGSVLRVPRQALEAMIGGPIHLPCVTKPSRPVVRADEPEPRPASTLSIVARADQTDALPPARPTRPRRSRTRPAAQLDLFEPPAAS